MAKKKNTRTSKRTTTRRRSKRKQKKGFGKIGIVFLSVVVLLLIVAGVWWYMHPDSLREWQEDLKEVFHKKASGQPDKEVPTFSLPSPPREKPLPETAQTPSAEAGKAPEKGVQPAPKEGYKNLEYTYLRETRREQVIRHTGFMVSYNEHWRLPNWVGYELTRDKTQGKAKRQSRFLKDPHVKGSCPIHDDYTKTGYDRGHMAAAADMAWSEQAMKESFYLSNVCPQHPDLNRRKWKELEDKVRSWAVADSAIVIVCGPVVADRCEKIGKNTVSVPYQFFKVVLSPYTNPPRAIGFLFDNQRATGSLGNYAVTVDSVERVTGLNFFSSLPDEIEEFVEKTVDLLHWGLAM